MSTLEWGVCIIGWINHHTKGFMSQPLYTFDTEDINTIGSGANSRTINTYAYLLFDGFGLKSFGIFHSESEVDTTFISVDNQVSPDHY
jgi:hypothetical protein